MVKVRIFKILSILFLMVLVISVFLKIGMFGVVPDERIMFVYRTMFCVIVDIYILIQCCTKHTTVLTTKFSSKDTFLVNASGVIVVLMYLGLDWMFVYETCFADEQKMGSVSVILAVMVMLNVRENIIKKYTEK